MRSFVEAGCNSTICHSKGETALHTAIKRGYTSVVELLLPYNVPLPCRILPFAIQQRSPSRIVRLLIRNGADVNSTSSKGETALYLAITNYHESACRELVESFVGAGGNYPTWDSVCKAVLDASTRGHHSAVGLLLSTNDPLRCGILPFALEQRSPSRLVRFLVRSGANVHSTSSEGETIFHLAITNYDESTCLELVKSFVDAGGNPTVRNSQGISGLDSAIERGCDNLVLKLLLKGAYVHSAISKGEFLLLLAIIKDSESMCLELVKSFVEAGGGTNICNSMGKSILLAAIKRRYSSLLDALLSYGIPVSPDEVLVLRRLGLPKGKVEMGQSEASQRG